MRVEEVSGTDAHVADLLALYHLDALDRRSGEQVGRHLESCAQCRAAAAEVCETLGALALLTDDSDELLNLYGGLGTAVPPAFPARFAPQVPPAEPEGRPLGEAPETERRRFRLRREAAPPRTVVAPPPVARQPGAPKPVDQEPAAPKRVVEKPAVPKPVVQKPVVPKPAAPKPAAPKPAAPKPAVQRSVAPPARPATERPLNHRRAETPRRRFAFRRAASVAGLSGLLLLTLAVAGISARALLDPSDPGRQTATVRTAVASATDRDSGAELSVFLTEQGGKVAVRATLSGLDEGAGYRLYGYTFDGGQRPLVNWTGRDGVQEVDGELPVAITAVSHFAVTRGTRVVVTAYLPRDGGGQAPPGR